MEHKQKFSYLQVTLYSISSNTRKQLFTIRPLKQLSSARLYLSIVKLSVNIDLALCDVSRQIWCGMRDIWTVNEEKKKQIYETSNTIIHFLCFSQKAQ